MTARVRGHFIEPMLLLRANALPDDRRWDYRLKLDGYRAIAFKTRGWQVTDVFKENGISGPDLHKLVERQKMMVAAKRGDFDVLRPLVQGLRSPAHRGRK
jgi:hypothetical protein